MPGQDFNYEKDRTWNVNCKWNYGYYKGIVIVHDAIYDVKTIIDYIH